MNTTFIQPPTAPSIRVWSPKAVGLFSVFLAFPAALALAIGNWRALGLPARIRPHLLGAIGLAVPLSLLLLLAPSRLGQFFVMAVNLAGYAYFKVSLTADLQAFRSANPASQVQRRPWYTGLGWALLGVLLFLAVYFIFGFGAVLIGIEVPE